MNKKLLKRPTKRGIEVNEDDADVTLEEESREIYLVGTVTTEKAGGILAAIRHLDKTNGPITLVVCSPGGEDGAGWVIYDALRLCNNQTIVQCYGECQSIAALVLQGGDIRLLSPHCRFMVHNGSLAFDATVTELRALVTEVEVLTQSYYKALCDRSGYTEEGIRELCDKETYLSAKETVDYGFADGILSRSRD